MKKRGTAKNAELFIRLREMRMKHKAEMVKTETKLYKLNFRIKKARQRHLLAELFAILLLNGVNALEREKESLRDQLAFYKKNISDIKKAEALLMRQRYDEYLPHVKDMSERMNKDITRLNAASKPRTLKELLKEMSDSEAVNYAVASTLDMRR